MLPPFIIEQIRKREEDVHRREAEQQPRLELPLEYIPSHRPPPVDNEADRGCIILDLG